jgi:hypothetical protein
MGRAQSAAPKKTATMAAAACEPAMGECAVATPPKGWAGAAARWAGHCLGHGAEGLGVLKE